MPTLRVLLTAQQIQSRIQELGAQIERDYPNGPVYLVGILKGACIFLSDLARAMNTPARLEFVGISSYGRGRSTSGEVKLTKDLDVSVEGQDVIVVEDIVDSGITLSYLIQVFRQRRPRSLRVATLLDKPERRQRRFGCPEHRRDHRTQLYCADGTAERASGASGRARGCGR